MMSKTKIRSADIKKFVLMTIIVVILAMLSYYVVNYPQDKIVERFISYERILRATKEHIYIVVISSVLSIFTAVPLGILITRTNFKKFANRVLGVVNIGQTIPSLAIVALFVGVFGIGAKTAILALWIYSLLPILRNTMVGILNLDESVLEAARGMGMTPFRILNKIELPLAMPIILAGIRTAITINIGTAVLAAFVGGGGLGDLIISGNNINRWQIRVLGASFPALLAIFVDTMFAFIEEKTAV